MAYMWYLLFFKQWGKMERINYKTISALNNISRYTLHKYLFRGKTGLYSFRFTHYK